MIIVPVEERNDFNTEAHKFFDMIQVPELKSFVADMINTYGSEEKLLEANKVADVLVAMLKKKGLLNGLVQQSFIDVLLVSTLLHNLFYDPINWTTLYIARAMMETIGLDGGIPQQVLDAIFQTIEAQLGDSTPVPTSRPQPNTPTELFTWAVWFAKEYKPQF